jgi:peroxiredoxin
MFCREQFARFADHAEAFAQAGVELVAIGSGTGPFAEDFLEHMRALGHRADVRVLVDPQRQSYQAFAMKRGAFDVLKPTVWRASRRAMAAGYRQGMVRGDALQNGGAVVVDTSGRVRFAHVQAHAGDLVEPEVVLAVARKTG